MQTDRHDRYSFLFCGCPNIRRVIFYCLLGGTSWDTITKHITVFGSQSTLGKEICMTYSGPSEEMMYAKVLPHMVVTSVAKRL